MSAYLNALMEEASRETLLEEVARLYAELEKAKAQNFDHETAIAALEGEVKRLRNPPCEHSHQHGWFDGVEMRLSCLHCGKAMTPKTTGGFCR